MKGIVLIAVAAFAVLSGCKKEKPDAPPAPTAKAATNSEAASTSSGNPILAPLEYISAAGRAQVAADKATDLASINQAVTMFQATEGRYPKDLNELVTSGTIRKLPAPPHGMQIQYDPGTGKVRITKQ